MRPSPSCVHSLRMPRCPACNREYAYAVFENAPYILPCCHTFCWRCVSRINRPAKQQRDTRHAMSLGEVISRLCRGSGGKRCPTCWESFDAYQLNLASLDLILQLKLHNSELISCNECLKRVPGDYLRRCQTCEREVRQRVNFPRVSCVICLECALDTHQGHELRRDKCTQLYENEMELLRRSRPRSVSPNAHPAYRIRVQVPRVAGKRRSISHDAAGRRKDSMEEEGRRPIMVECMSALLKSMRVKTEKVVSLVNDLSSRCLQEVRRGWMGSRESPPTVFLNIHNTTGAGTSYGDRDAGGFVSLPLRPVASEVGQRSNASRVVHKYENVVARRNSNCEQATEGISYTYVCFHDDE